MKTTIKFIQGAVISTILTLSAATVLATPALQLGNGSTGDWTYDSVSDTWVTNSSAFTLNALANASTGNGAFAWEDGDSDMLRAFLVVAATPQTPNDPPMAPVTDYFNFDIDPALSFVDSGYGIPPLADLNDIQKHGIFETYFEIYEFDFDGVQTIYNTQDGQTCTLCDPSAGGDGYIESFAFSNVTFRSPATGLHFDLYTLKKESDQVYRNAPYSHDAAYDPSTPVPAPHTLALFALALIGLGTRARRLAA